MVSLCPVVLMSAPLSHASMTHHVGGRRVHYTHAVVETSYDRERSLLSSLVFVSRGKTELAICQCFGAH